MSSQKIIAIIPAFNEEIGIGGVVLRTKKFVDDVLVVDDGSSDKTAEIAKLAGAEVISLDKNHGKAFALFKGFEEAKEKGADIVVILDGDCQHFPEEIPILIEPITKGEADLVNGSRYLMKNYIPGHRIFAHKLLNLCTNAANDNKSKENGKITDSQSGFRALNKNALNNMNFKSDGFNIESDMIVHFLSKGLRIAEVPISVKYKEIKKQGKHLFVHGFGLLDNLVGLISFKRPLLLFGLFGLLCLFSGFLFGAWTLISYNQMHKLPFGPSLIAGISFVLGLVSIMSGLILNSLVQIKNEKMPEKI